MLRRSDVILDCEGNNPTALFETGVLPDKLIPFPLGSGRQAPLRMRQGRASLQDLRNLSADCPFISRLKMSLRRILRASKPPFFFS
jgi:hypothetical protein